MTSLDDETLRRMNAAMAPLEEAGYRDLSEQHPMLFVAGAPRSGTTLAVQLVASNLDVGYVTNLAAAFWSAPVFGVCLSKKLLCGRLRSSYQSTFGRTASIEEPHEFGRFWIRLLAPYGLAEPPPGMQDEIDWPRFRRVLVNLGHAFGKPSVLKAAMLAWHVERVCSLLSRARFVWVRREPVANVLSILKYRNAMHGSEDEWVSLLPKEHEQLRAVSVEEQAAAQVHLIDRAIERQARQLGPDRILEVRYESMCERPGQFLDAVCGLYERCGARVRRVADPPEPFEAKPAVATAPRYAAVAAAVASYSKDGRRD